MVLVIRFQILTIRYCLRILLFSIDEVFPVCRKECLDTFVEHIVCYRELPCFKYQYDFVKGVFFIFV